MNTGEDAGHALQPDEHSDSERQGEYAHAAGESTSSRMVPPPRIDKIPNFNIQQYNNKNGHMLWRFTVTSKVHSSLRHLRSPDQQQKIMSVTQYDDYMETSTEDTR